MIKDRAFSNNKAHGICSWVVEEDINLASR